MNQGELQGAPIVKSEEGMRMNREGGQAELDKMDEEWRMRTVKDEQDECRMWRVEEEEKSGKKLKRHRHCSHDSLATDGDESGSSSNSGVR